VSGGETWEKGGCMCVFSMNCPIVDSGADARALALGRNTGLPAQFARTVRLQMRRTGLRKVLHVRHAGKPLVARGSPSMRIA
jgi:hypothetical protein